MPDSADDIQRPPPPHLLVFPFPAQGHLIPIVNLSENLVSRFGFSITVVVTPKNLPLILPHVTCSPQIHPLVLSLPSSSVLSSEAEHVRDLPHGVHSVALIRALSSLLPLVHEWACSQPQLPSAILSDFFLGFCLDLALDLRIPHLAFFSSGALLASLLHQLFLLPSHTTSLPIHPHLRFSSLPSFLFSHLLPSSAATHAAILNTFDFLESPYLAHLRATAYASGRIWAVGPIFPSVASTDENEKILRWLDICPKRSVVYVCFGSQFTLEPAVTTALAAALEGSGARFLWAVGQGGAYVPEGFEARVGARGMVWRGWAPQVAVLRHKSVGAFLTHCGWNSVLEGLTAGVVLLAWPMEADQFVNAQLLVEEAGVAVSAWAGGSGTVPEVGELARVIAESVEEENWPELRARAAEMGKRAKQAVTEGGSSFVELEQMVKLLTRTAVGE
ncbi:hypothetical protein HPP92_005915 [Vanilla planifolia]|uniref:Uncharacterized protein n=1 Tax=Vanilla planifolia TaxID=51239 RepID=A0A835VBE8_VANPL|nr:hypothetical protein HPP92_005915 [Vanilla planifolia]